jgi:hypothetical protein
VLTDNNDKEIKGSDNSCAFSSYEAKVPKSNGTSKNTRNQDTVKNNEESTYPSFTASNDRAQPERNVTADDTSNTWTKERVYSLISRWMERFESAPWSHAYNDSLRMAMMWGSIDKYNLMDIIMKRWGSSLDIDQVGAQEISNAAFEVLRDWSPSATIGGAQLPDVVREIWRELWGSAFRRLMMERLAALPQDKRKAIGSFVAYARNSVAINFRDDDVPWKHLIQVIYGETPHYDPEGVLIWCGIDSVRWYSNKHGYTAYNAPWWPSPEQILTQTVLEDLWHEPFPMPNIGPWWTKIDAKGRNILRSWLNQIAYVNRSDLHPPISWASCYGVQRHTGKSCEELQTLLTEPQICYVDPTQIVVNPIIFAKIEEHLLKDTEDHVQELVVNLTPYLPAGLQLLEQTASGLMPTWAKAGHLSVDGHDINLVFMSQWIEPLPTASPSRNTTTPTTTYIDSILWNANRACLIIVDTPLDDTLIEAFNAHWESYHDRLALLFRDHGQWAGIVFDDLTGPLSTLVSQMARSGVDWNTCHRSSSKDGSIASTPVSLDTRAWPSLVLGSQNALAELFEVQDPRSASFQALHNGKPCIIILESSPDHDGLYFLTQWCQGLYREWEGLASVTISTLRDWLPAVPAERGTASDRIIQAQSLPSDRELLWLRLTEFAQTERPGFFIVALNSPDAREFFSDCVTRLRHSVVSVLWLRLARRKSGDRYRVLSRLVDLPSLDAASLGLDADKPEPIDDIFGELRRYRQTLEDEMQPEYAVRTEPNQGGPESLEHWQLKAFVLRALSERYPDHHPKTEQPIGKAIAIDVWDPAQATAYEIETFYGEGVSPVRKLDATTRKYRNIGEVRTLYWVLSGQTYYRCAEDILARWKVWRNRTNLEGYFPEVRLALPNWSSGQLMEAIAPHE